MQDTITLESIRRFDIKPGEILAVTTGYELDADEQEWFAGRLREILDPSIKVMILPPGTRVDIISPVPA